MNCLPTNHMHTCMLGVCVHKLVDSHFLKILLHKDNFEKERERKKLLPNVSIPVSKHAFYECSLWL